MGCDIMIVSEIRPIGKIGKDLLKNENSDRIIEKIIEKPLQKACKIAKSKNIETVMSSANKKNVVWKKEDRINRAEIEVHIQQRRMLSFTQAGKGYAWIMLNYNTLSDENRKILFSLEKELGEQAIWFVKSNYIEFLNRIRKVFKLKELAEVFDDTYAKQFKKRQLLLMYNNKYPRRSVFLRMPIEPNTQSEEIELYFCAIMEKLAKQE